MVLVVCTAAAVGVPTGLVSLLVPFFSRSPRGVWPVEGVADAELFAEEEEALEGARSSFGRP